jgi:hypothetical protein
MLSMGFYLFYAVYTTLRAFKPSDSYLLILLPIIVLNKQALMINCFLNPTIKLIFLALIILTAAKNTKAQQLAFPGAEGYGKYATGGRGGKVAIVTNLQDDGPGSFRQALAAYPGKPLTVVFQVSGIIELSSPLILKRSNVTVAGQTAPGDGICLKGHSFIINGASKGGNHGNIIIRYIRSRPGSNYNKGVYGLDIENCHDIIIRMCSRLRCKEHNYSMVYYQRRFV